jgi:hypothetical protein
VTTLSIRILGFGVSLSVERERPRDKKEPLGLIKAMSKMGIDPADADAAGQDPAFLRALERCPECALTVRCAASLSAAGAGSLPDACPSRGLLADIADYKATHPARRSSFLADFAGVRRW